MRSVLLLVWPVFLEMARPRKGGRAVQTKVLLYYSNGLFSKDLPSLESFSLGPIMSITLLYCLPCPPIAPMSFYLKMPPTLFLFPSSVSINHGTPRRKIPMRNPPFPYVPADKGAYFAL